jgi:hypothetical protein
MEVAAFTPNIDAIYEATLRHIQEGCHLSSQPWLEHQTSCDYVCLFQEMTLRKKVNLYDFKQDG